jgi:iron complex transport system ATP-binding protein
VGQLDARHVSFSYPTHTAFSLDAVSLSVERGSITGLLGPNGGGKSTLLRILAGILRPDTGDVLLDGHSLTRLPRREAARRMALVPQGTHPTFDFTALEMVLMGRHPHLGAFELEGPGDLTLAHDAMEATGTTNLADRSFLTLSGGEQQRVALASALAQSPQVLLLDEPTASLDLGYQLEIGALLSALNRERAVTMVVATHDLNFAARICDHLVLMRNGRVFAEGPTSTTLTSQAIAHLYDVDARVSADEGSGRLVVVPRGRRS